MSQKNMKALYWAGVALIALLLILFVVLDYTIWTGH